MSRKRNLDMKKKRVILLEMSCGTFITAYTETNDTEGKRDIIIRHESRNKPRTYTEPGHNGGLSICYHGRRRQLSNSVLTFEASVIIAAKLV